MDLYKNISQDKIDKNYDGMVRMALAGWHQDKDSNMLNRILDGAKQYLVDATENLKSGRCAKTSPGSTQNTHIYESRTRSGRLDQPSQQAIQSSPAKVKRERCRPISHTPTTHRLSTKSTGIAKSSKQVNTRMSKRDVDQSPQSSDSSDATSPTQPSDHTNLLKRKRIPDEVPDSADSSSDTLSSSSNSSPAQFPNLLSPRKRARLSTQRSQTAKTSPSTAETSSPTEIPSSAGTSSSVETSASGYLTTSTGIVPISTQHSLPAALMQQPKRVTKACHVCRRKKIRCDGKQPCSHCTVNSYDCTYGPTSETAFLSKTGRTSQPAKRSSETASTKKPCKVAKACYNCRIKKTKCDGELPCSQCSGLSYSCTYDKPAPTAASSKLLSKSLSESSQAAQQDSPPSSIASASRKSLIVKLKVSPEKLAAITGILLKVEPSKVTEQEPPETAKTNGSSHVEKKGRVIRFKLSPGKEAALAESSQALDREQFERGDIPASQRTLKYQKQKTFSEMM